MSQESPNPRLSAWLVLSMLGMIAVPAAITLHTVHVPAIVKVPSSNPTPYGYTWSLLLFVVPIVVIAGAEGNITSTNTWGNIPAPDVYPGLLNMSPSGQLLAVAENRNGFAPGFAPRAPGTNGLQIFHFNGANPITPYSKTLTTAPIDQIHWDNNNHLYALSDSTNKLYVYTVTPTTIAAAPGSPYTIAGPNGLVVVPILCGAPTSPGVHICSPASGSTVHSPVLINAASTVTGTIARMEVWVDGVKKYTSTSSNVLNTSVNLAAGTHRFGVFAINSAGQKWENAISATVQ